MRGGGDGREEAEAGQQQQQQQGEEEEDPMEFLRLKRQQMAAMGEMAAVAQVRRIGCREWRRLCRLTPLRWLARGRHRWTLPSRCSAECSR